MSANYWAKQAAKKFVDINVLHQLGCLGCSLYNLPNKHRDIQPGGSTRVGCDYILGLGPGKTETDLNQFWAGDAGTYLKKAFTDRQWENIRYNNVTRTRHPEDKPSYENLESCRPSVEKDIALYKPRAIFAFGGYPLKWAFHTDRDIAINAWRGHRFPINILGHTTWMFPMLHPSGLLRGLKDWDGNPKLEYLFKLDIKYAYEFLSRNIKPEVVDPKHAFDNVECLYKIDDIIKALMQLAKEPSLAVDLETTPWRPYKGNAKIWTIAIGTFNRTIAFPYHHPQHTWHPDDFRKLKNFLHIIYRNKKIRKIAHNSGFELERLVYEHDDPSLVAGNWVDTMSSATRLGFGGNAKQSEGGEEEKLYKGLLALDNLTMVYYGINLKSLTSGLDKAKLDREKLSKVLLYNGGDTKFTHGIDAKLQADVEFEGLQEPTYQFNRRISAVVLMQRQGINIDQGRVEYHSKRIEDRVLTIYKEIISNPQVIEYQSKYGKFSAGSHDDVKNFFKSLGYDMKNKDGKEAADDFVLQKIDNQLAKVILNYRELDKLKGTYINSFDTRQASNIIYPDHKIHPLFPVHFTSSDRLCIAKGSYIDTPRDLNKYPDGIPIENIKVGDLVYSFDSNNYLTLNKVKWAGKTGTKKVIRLHWRLGNDKGATGYLDLTPDHKIRCMDGRDIQAKDSLGESIRSLYRQYKLGYSIFTLGGVDIREHRFVFETITGIELDKEDVIHHVDHNKLNNDPDNLDLTTPQEHTRYHTIEMWKDNSIRESIIQSLKNREHKKGKESYNWIELNKWQCLRIIANCRGQLTKNTAIEHKTLLKKLMLNNISLKHIQDRYGREGKYIGKAWLKNNLPKLGVKKLKEDFKIDFYRLKRLVTAFEIKKYSKRPFDYSITNKYSVLRHLIKVDGQISKVPFNYQSFLNKCHEFGIDPKVVKERLQAKVNHLIYAIEELDQEVDVYDLEIEDTHTFIANGLCCHNSSREPNSQNFVKRKNKDVRDIFKAPEGHVYFSADYGQIQFRMFPIVTHDQLLIDSITNGLDIHGYWAMKLSKAYPKRVGLDNYNQWAKVGDVNKLKDENKLFAAFRDTVKNGWVFPSCFGASYKSLAGYMNIPESVAKEFRDMFWEELPKVKKWQEDTLKFLKENGYVEAPTGCRRYGPIDSGEAINYPIQHLEAYLVMDGFCRLSEYALSTNQFKFQPINQVHDCLDFYLPEDTWREDARFIIRTMLDFKFAFINVPLAVEATYGPDWFHQQKFGTYYSNKLEEI